MNIYHREKEDSETMIDNRSFSLQLNFPCRFIYTLLSRNLAFLVAFYKFKFTLNSNHIYNIRGSKESHIPRRSRARMLAYRGRNNIFAANNS